MSLCRRALRNNDVLHEIFTWLRPPPLYDEITPWEEEIRKEAQHSLVNAAVVCKDFAGHALDALWRELDDLLPVVQLFTEFNDFEVDGMAAGEDVSCLSYLISENEWGRFRVYARRVRVIYSSGFGAFETSMLLYLARHNVGKALFPYLRCLTHQVTSDLDTGLLPLMTPTLESARLVFCDKPWSGIDIDESPAIARKMRDYAVQGQLRNICSNVPRLKWLTVTGLGRISSLSPLLACHQLRQLHLHDIVLSHQLLRTLASLDSLRELNLQFTLTTCDFYECTGFTNLTSILLSGPMYQIPVILNIVSSQHVRSVRLVDPSNKATCNECFKCIQAAAKFVLLEEFHLAADDAIATDCSATSAPLTELLGPLLQRRTLRTLSVSRWQPGGLAFGDTDLQTLADAWPDMHSLAISVNRAEVIPTLHALVVVARAFPALRELELPSITILDAAQLRPRPELGPHPLCHFEVGDPDKCAEGYDPAQVARWLHDIFPQFSMPGECEDFPEFLACLLGELQRLQLVDQSSARERDGLQRAISS